ncbi:MAG: response regulator [Blastocatellia bacterium]
MAKVLVVDDTAGIRTMLLHALADTHEVRLAVNGQEAVRLAESFVPDVILMDLDMPVMDGLEASRQIKSTPATAHIRVIATTGQKHSERAIAIQEWCDAFIEKPFRVPDLRALIEKLYIETRQEAVS